MSPSEFEPAFQRLGLDSLKLSPEAEHVAGLRMIVRPWDRLAQIKEANWWLDLIGVLTSNEALGIIPWFLPSSPVACISTCEASLVASSPNFLLPMAVFRAWLDAGSDYWNELRTKWEPVKNELLAAHYLLGGRDNLMTLENVLFNDELREACDPYGKGEPLNIEAARADVLQSLDPDPHQKSYRRYIQRLLERGFQWPLPEDIGPWRGSAACAAFSVIQFEDNRSESAISCAWEVVTWPTGLGLCHPGEPVHIDIPSGGEAVMLVCRAAELIVAEENMLPDQYKRDQRLAAIQALAQGDTSKAHDQYFKIAKKLRIAGQWSYAWKALLCAAFWGYQTYETGERAIIEEALILTREARWIETHSAIKAIVRVHDEEQA